MSPRHFAVALTLLAVVGCASTPKPVTGPAVAPEGPTFTLRPAAFRDLPGWGSSDPAAALAAFRLSCSAQTRRDDAQPFGRFATYGGTVADWRAPCAAAQAATDARAFFEQNFTPNEVVARPDQTRRVTGYYEPVVQARRVPQPGFDEPFLARPADAVGIDLAAFDEAADISSAITADVMKSLAPVLPDETEARASQTLDDRLARRFRTPLFGRLTADRKIIPLPARAGIDKTVGVLGYARACDVYDVQVQGSARVLFEDGAQMRMAYAAQNGYQWTSIYPQLRDRGAPSATKDGMCAYFAQQAPDGVRAGLNLDPSYVFFTLEPIGDPNAGPKGAQGVPLTAMGSAAVDPSAHPYGALLFIAADNGLQRLFVAQDTGGAIKRGPLRADVFFGTGDAAGAAAGQQNAPARFWSLLPNGLANRPVAQSEGLSRSPG